MQSNIDQQKIETPDTAPDSPIDIDLTVEECTNEADSFEINWDDYSDVECEEIDVSATETVPSFAETVERDQS
ncbi:hypothetical protein ABG067_008763, partial [Albugo candida]